MISASNIKVQRKLGTETMEIVLKRDIVLGPAHCFPTPQDRFGKIGQRVKMEKNDALYMIQLGSARELNEQEAKKR